VETAARIARAGDSARHRADAGIDVPPGRLLAARIGHLICTSQET
jgi:hypothetical protein